MPVRIYQNLICPPVLNRPDCTPVVDDFKALIPEKVPLLVSARLASQFCGRNEVFFHKRDIHKCNYAIFDVMDLNFDRGALDLRYLLLKSKEFSTIKAKRFENHFFVLLKKDAPETVPSPLISPIKFPSQFKSYDIPLENKDFNFKMICAPDSKKNVLLQLTTLKTVDYDVIIVVRFINESTSVKLNWLYGNGTHPAYLSKRGQAFYMKNVLPDGFDDIKAVQATLQKI